jgi:signal transduction histidine kinase
MKRFAQLGIYQKIISVTIASLILLSLLVGLLVWTSLETALSHQFEKRGVEIATRLASLCTEHILFNDPFALHEVVSEVKASSEDIRYILVMDHTGRVLAHTFAEGLPLGLIELQDPASVTDHQIESIHTDEGLMLDILVPVEQGKVGYARVGISERFIRTLIRSKLQVIFLITLLVCAGAVFLSARITARITRPLTLLAGAAKDIAAGKLDSRVEIRTGDEVGQLTAAFNNMADSLIASTQEKDTLLAALQEKEHMRDILLHKLITAQEDERKRISRELHDETSQALTSLLVSMRLLADDTTSQDTQAVIQGIRDMTVRILTDVRNLAVELRPPLLDDLGLAVAMQKYIEKFQDRYGIAVDYAANLADGACDSQISLALYRIMQESLTNIVRHAGASHVRVRLEDRDDYILLVIVDNGRGIRQEALRQAKADNRVGLYGMQERAELLGGTFKMHATTAGTSIIITIPHQTETREEGSHG